MALSSSRTAPQPAGTTITFTAVPNGGATPQQYKWLMHDGTSWRIVGDWSTANTFNWTPTITSSQYRFGVWVRSAGNTVDAGEATTSVDFAITQATTPAPTTTTPPPVTSAPAVRLTAVTISANLVAPQPAGTTIAFTANPNGGAAPQQYKWLYHDGSTWRFAGDWSTSTTFNWSPTFANSQYRIGVWVRSAGNTVDAGEATTSVDFPISASTTAAPPPPPPPPAGKLTGVTLGSNLLAPQPLGSTITWTAIAAGGAAPLQYRWWMYDGVAWTSTAWTTSNLLAWRPTAASPYARVSVWVRSAGSTADIYEVSTEQYFAIR